MTKMHKTLDSDDVNDFIDNSQTLSGVDLNNISFMVRYKSDSSIILCDVLDDVNWDRLIRDFIIDFGDEKCFIWRKGVWKGGKSESYRKKANLSYSIQRQHYHSHAHANSNTDYSDNYREKYLSEQEVFEFWYERDSNIKAETREVSISKLDATSLDFGVNLSKVFIRNNIKKNINDMMKIPYEDNHTFFHTSLIDIYNRCFPGVFVNNFKYMEYEFGRVIYTVQSITNFNVHKTFISWAKVYFNSGMLYYSNGSWFLCYISK